ncbi:MAG TPA: ECF-type sigma factor [Gemmataceae bacterium]|nr:ECF-type sigma factor [Gemmataceae bacterium]
MSSDEDVTIYLRQARTTKDPQLEGRVFALVQDHLKVLARSLVRGFDGDPTLQPTLLVDEAFLRLMRSGKEWESRSTFFRLAYGTMRRILITHQRRKRPRRLETDAVEILEDDGTTAPSRPVEDEELLGSMSGALQDFLDRGDPDLVNTFLLSFFHRIGKAAGLRAEDLIAEFTGDRAPLREVAGATGRSIPAAWRRLGKALEFLQEALHKRGVE